MNILLLGSGGRECAIAWKLSQSERLGRLLIAPGNAGTAQYGENVSVSPLDFEAVARLALDNEVQMLVVGNEDPLVAGIADYFHGNQLLSHILVVGPERAGAMLEGSKHYAKQFMLRHGIPTAASLSVRLDNIAEGEAFLERQAPPFVLKADGLAAGKGVLIIDSLDEAKRQLRAMLDGKFGAASSTVVIEQYLSGIECSEFVLTDGKDYILLPEAKDYKRVGEGDEGLNTGGMGAVSPVPFADDEFQRRVRERIIEPTLAGLRADGISYCGFIFFGLMNVGGDPYVIEYNVRMGDPETEVVMPRLSADLVTLLEHAARGCLCETVAGVEPDAAVTVMMVSGGYPEHYEKDKTISGLADNIEGTVVFHAGTALDGEGKVVTSGGRVIAVTGRGATLDDARRKAYERVATLSFDKCYHRRDIALDVMA